MKIGPSRSILVVRIGRLGDFLVALPAISIIRKRYPEHKIVLLTGISGSSKIGKIAQKYTGEGAPPWIKFCYPSMVDEVISTSSLYNLAELYRLRARLRSVPPPEIAFILSYFGETVLSIVKKRLWLRMLGVAARICDGGNAKNAPRPAGVSAQMWAPIRVADSCEPSCLQPDWQTYMSVFPRPKDAAELLAQLGVPMNDKLLVIVAPSATHEHKKWPENHFGEVVRQLTDRFGCTVLLVGATSDFTCSEFVRKESRSNRVYNICGKTELSQLVSLMSISHLFLGNDGGLAHLAAAAGIPCVTIMSGVHAEGVWDPTAIAGEAIRVPGLPCVGCGNEFYCPAGNNRCITEIHVDRVVQSCAGILAR